MYVCMYVCMYECMYVCMHVVQYSADSASLITLDEKVFGVFGSAQGGQGHCRAVVALHIAAVQRDSSLSVRQSGRVIALGRLYVCMCMHVCVCTNVNVYVCMGLLNLKSMY